MVESFFLVLPPVLVPRQQEMPKKVPDTPTLDDLGRPADNITIPQDMGDQGYLLIFPSIFICMSHFL